MKEKGEVAKEEEKPKGYRNALAVLKRFELVVIEKNNYMLALDRINKFSNYSEAIWISANSESILLEVVKLIESNNDVSGKDIGNVLSDKYDLSWAEASRIRNGGSIRQWALWLYEGKVNSEIPKCPGRT